ncbi:MAG: hypothetical protein EHM70_22735 [Chloroflexota bacterium]|nr:MAG: hypothetical protein EHM70_22735 [Chloroflexota bacterium]
MIRSRCAADLLIDGSPTQAAWLRWLESVVTRWPDRVNIFAWEIYSEVNLTENATEENGINFVERSAAVARAADSSYRPLTASLAGVGY